MKCIDKHFTIAEWNSVFKRRKIPSKKASRRQYIKEKKIEDSLSCPKCGGSVDLCGGFVRPIGKDRVKNWVYINQHVYTTAFESWTCNCMGFDKCGFFVSGSGYKRLDKYNRRIPVRYMKQYDSIRDCAFDWKKHCNRKMKFI